MKNRDQIALSKGYRSGLENAVAESLKARGCECEYEPYALSYMQPEAKRKYTPDFVLPNGIIIETKGRFTSEDRKKHLWIRDSNPELDIRFVFQYPNGKIRKGSKTSYADWCNKHGLLWASKDVPDEWIEEESVNED